MHIPLGIFILLGSDIGHFWTLKGWIWGPLLVAENCVSGYGYGGGCGLDLYHFKEGRSFRNEKTVALSSCLTDLDFPKYPNKMIGEAPARCVPEEHLREREGGFSQHQLVSDQYIYARGAPIGRQMKKYSIRKRWAQVQHTYLCPWSVALRALSRCQRVVGIVPSLQ